MIEEIFLTANKLRAEYLANNRTLTEKSKALRGIKVMIAFFEPSTRTSLTFRLAAMEHGATLMFSDFMGISSSMVKGESLDDTMRFVAETLGCKLIIMRHTDMGAAQAAADFLSSKFPDVSLINAGDGAGEHPTQALLDLYALENELGSSYETFDGIDKKVVLIGGDIKHSRTVRSLLETLKLYEGVTVILAAPDEFQIEDERFALLKESNLTVVKTNDPTPYWREVDGIYWTRLQQERHEEIANHVTQAIGKLYNLLPEKIKEWHVRPPKTPGYPQNFVIDARTLEKMQPHSRIFHPKPRVNEISREVDNDPRMAMFRQEQGGFFIRLALLQMLIENTI